MDIPNLTIGRICFEAYRTSVGNLTYDGKPIPPWEALTNGDQVRNAWEAGAQAVKEHLELAAFISGRTKK